MVNELRAGFFRNRNDSVPVPYFTNAEFGIANPFADQVPDLTQITIDGDDVGGELRFGTLGDGTRIFDRQTTWTAGNTLSLVARPPLDARGRRAAPERARRRSAGDPQPAPQLRHVVRLSDRRLRESRRSQPRPTDFRHRAERRLDGSQLPDDRLELVLADDWKRDVESHAEPGHAPRLLRVSVRAERLPRAVRFSGGARDRQRAGRVRLRVELRSGLRARRRGPRPEHLQPQEHRPARLQQLRAACRASRGSRRRSGKSSSAAAMGCSTSGHRRVRELAAAGAAVLPRAAAQRRRQLEHDPERRADVSGAGHERRVRRWGADSRGRQRSRHRVRGVRDADGLDRPRDAVHASVEPHDAVGVPAELADRGGLRRQQGQQAAAVGEPQSGDRRRRRLGCCGGRACPAADSPATTSKSTTTSS